MSHKVAESYPVSDDVDAEQTWNRHVLALTRAAITRETDAAQQRIDLAYALSALRDLRAELDRVIAALEQRP